MIIDCFGKKISINKDFFNKGVWLNGGSTLQNCIIEGFEKGVLVQGQNNIVSQNLFISNQKGIDLNQGKNSKVFQNIVVGGDRGINFDNFPNDNEITQNKVCGPAKVFCGDNPGAVTGSDNLFDSVDASCTAWPKNTDYAACNTVTHCDTTVCSDGYVCNAIKVCEMDSKNLYGDCYVDLQCPSNTKCVQSSDSEQKGKYCLGVENYDCSSNAGDCGKGYKCVASDSSGGSLCKKVMNDGESCADSKISVCGRDSTCVEGVCKPKPCSKELLSQCKSKEQCEADSVSGTWFMKDSFGKCIQISAECTADQTTCPPDSCEYYGGSYTDFAGCSPKKLDYGAKCGVGTIGVCGSGLSCDSSSNTCLNIVGESCSATSKCVMGVECVGGVCAAKAKVSDNEACTQNSDCVSENCVATLCVAKFLAINDECSVDSGCPSNTKCVASSDSSKTGTYCLGVENYNCGTNLNVCGGGYTCSNSQCKKVVAENGDCSVSTTVCEKGLICGASKKCEKISCSVGTLDKCDPTTCVTVAKGKWTGNECIIVEDGCDTDQTKCMNQQSCEYYDGTFDIINVKCTPKILVANDVCNGANYKGGACDKSKGLSCVEGTCQSAMVKGLKGDVNCDGKVNSNDFIATKLYLKGVASGAKFMKAGTTTEECISGVNSADVNCDGKVNSNDFIATKLYLKGVASGAKFIKA